MNSVIHTELRAGQAVRIGDAVVTLGSKSGKTARLTIVAPRTTRIDLPPRAQECAPITTEPSHGKYPL